MAEPWIGFQFPTRKVSWLKRDVLLYNISIGCKADEPQYVYEGHKRFSAFPTLPLGLVFKLDTQEVIDFYATQGAVKIPGVPDLDPTRLVDGDRTLQVVRPLPVTSAGRQFEFRSHVLGVWDKGKAGTVVRSEDALVDAETGDVYARNIGSLFYVGQGGWGGPRGSPADRFPPPDGLVPDVEFDLVIDQTAAHLYRLNGDYNPLHATPQYGQRMGFGGIIMHGVFAYSQIAHEFVRRLGASDPTCLREISARFSGPVKPGDTVNVKLWHVGAAAAPVEGDVGDYRWTAQVRGAGKLCLCDGTAQLKIDGGASKI
ncbi:MaoC like domain [Geosmithia morbida]|uniref:MaoC like domain n=1 Tax=Geosmithia morbida TaxID=1094350 RepID=A0A9P5D560_9HYPO|nr:MaoC like domain [Geosmithia morbida]KAF4124231.1 MaoC like domain [Geosmithia morbida]